MEEEDLYGDLVGDDEHGQQQEEDQLQTSQSDDLYDVIYGVGRRPTASAQCQPGSKGDDLREALR
jgi:hypothetical protein